MPAFRILGILLILITTCGLIDLYNILFNPPRAFKSGGIFGTLISHGVSLTFNSTGSTLILSAFLLISITLFTGLSWFRLIEGTGRLVWHGFDMLKHGLQSGAVKIPWNHLWQR